MTHFVHLLSLLTCLLLSATVSANENRTPFQPSTSVAETLMRHRTLPDPSVEVWWVPTGEAMRWNNRHLGQLFPTVPVYRNGPVRPLTYELNREIDVFSVETPDGPVPFLDFLNSEFSTSLGVVILHRGKIVFEHYARMQEYEKPIWWSVSKVFAASLMALLEERGQVDVTKTVDHYLPELNRSDFAGVTVRDVLDMASGVDCPDGIYERGACYYEFEASLNDAVRSEQTADTPYDALTNMRRGKWAPPGQGFDYSGANGFVLSWIVERVMGMPFHDAVTREIWFNIGAEGDAAFFAARYGIALSTGGFMAKARDMARFGLLFTPSYQVVSDNRIISERYLNTILHEGRPDLLRNARFEHDDLTGIRHNVYQWDVVFTNDDVYKGGWAGQGLLINPRKDLVAVYLGYAKDDQFSELPVLPRLRQLLNRLYPGEANNNANTVSAETPIEHDRADHEL